MLTRKDIETVLKNTRTKVYLAAVEDELRSSWPTWNEPTPVFITNSKHKVTFFVSPDYAGIEVEGRLSASEFLRLPATPRVYEKILRERGWFLPCPGLVRALWSRADCRLVRLSETERDKLAILRHNDRVNDALISRHAGLGDFIVGAKKDVVIGRGDHNAIPGGSVVIYGWDFSERGDESGLHPKQPLFDRHGASYFDYSHGCRAVDGTVIVDGKSIPYDVALRDAALMMDLFGETYTWTRYP